MLAVTKKQKNKNISKKAEMCFPSQLFFLERMNITKRFNFDNHKMFVILNISDSDKHFASAINEYSKRL